MKYQLEKPTGGNAFTSYHENSVFINHKEHSSNVLVLPDSIDLHWTTATPDNITPEDLTKMVEIEADVYILGTGNRIRFPLPETMRPFYEHNKSLEVMDIQAACRTYNILLSEGRKVLVGLLFENTSP